MAKKRKKKPELPQKMRSETFRRTHKATFLLNDKENEAIEAYCKKYKIINKSRFMREAVLRAVMNQFMEDYPTLFEKQDLDRLVVKQNLQA